MLFHIIFLGFISETKHDALVHYQITLNSTTHQMKSTKQKEFLSEQFGLLAVALIPWSPVNGTADQRHAIDLQMQE